MSIFFLFFFFAGDISNTAKPIFAKSVKEDDKRVEIEKLSFGVTELFRCVGKKVEKGHFRFTNAAWRQNEFTYQKARSDTANGTSAQ